MPKNNDVFTAPVVDGEVYVENTNVQDWADQVDLEIVKRPRDLATVENIFLDPTFTRARSVGYAINGRTIIPDGTNGTWDASTKSWVHPSSGGGLLLFDAHFEDADSPVVEGDVVSAAAFVDGAEAGQARFRAQFLDENGNDVGDFVASETIDTEDGSQSVVKVEGLVVPALATAFRWEFQDISGSYEFRVPAVWLVDGSTAPDAPPLHRAAPDIQNAISPSIAAERLRTLELTGAISLNPDPIFEVARSATAIFAGRLLIDTRFSGSWDGEGWAVDAASASGAAFNFWFDVVDLPAASSNVISIATEIEAKDAVADPDNGPRVVVAVRSFSASPDADSANIDSAQIRLTGGKDRLILEDVAIPDGTIGIVVFYQNLDGANFRVRELYPNLGAVALEAAPTRRTPAFMAAAAIVAGGAADALQPYELVAPARLYGIVGEETRVYSRGLIAGHDLDFDFDYSPGAGAGAGLGRQFGNPFEHPVSSGRWIHTPDAVETARLLDIEVKDRRTAGTPARLSYATVPIDTVAANAATGLTRSVLSIGNSLTDTFWRGRRVLERVTANPSGIGITFLGTQDTSEAEPPNEGYGGKRIDDFYQRDDSRFAQSNFAAADGGLFNWSHFKTSTGITTTEVVDFFDGTNDVTAATSNEEAQAISEVICAKKAAMMGVSGAGTYATGVTSIRSIDPGINFTLWTIPLGNERQDAYGDDYEVGRTRAQVRRSHQIFNRELLRVFSGREAEGIVIVPGHCCSDTLHGFPSDNALHPWFRDGSDNLDYTLNGPNGHVSAAKEWGDAHYAALTVGVVRGWL